MNIKNPTALWICCYTTLWNINVSETNPYLSTLSQRQLVLIITLTRVYLIFEGFSYLLEVMTKSGVPCFFPRYTVYKMQVRLVSWRMQTCATCPLCCTQRWTLNATNKRRLSVELSWQHLQRLTCRDEVFLSPVYDKIPDESYPHFRISYQHNVECAENKLISFMNFHKTRNCYGQTDGHLVSVAPWW